MYLVRESDGKTYPDVLEAVRDFKCPGPCSPDCVLYPIAPLPGGDGACVHLCDDRYAATHPATVASLLGCSLRYDRTGGPREDVAPDDPGQAYVAVLKSHAVRDVQFCTNRDCDPEDDDSWQDLPDGEVFLGIFAGPRALDEAAAYGLTDPANVRLIPVPNAGKGGRA